MGRESKPSPNRIRRSVKKPQWDAVNDDFLMLQLQNGMLLSDLARYYNVSIEEVEAHVRELGFIDRV
jgi:hypothetical protein